MKIVLTNGEWYKIAENLINNPIGENTYIPVMYNFYIQKNINKILSIRNELDKCRQQIISHYGETDPTINKVSIRSDCINEANKELATLSQLKQEIDLYAIPLEAFEDVKLTTGELKGLMPMLIPDPELSEHLLSNPDTYEYTITAKIT